MVEINWTLHSKDDLQNIYDYISNDSEVYALRVIEKIIDATFVLEKFQDVLKLLLRYGRHRPTFLDVSVIVPVFVYSFDFILLIFSSLFKPLFAHLHICKLISSASPHSPTA